MRPIPGTLCTLARENPACTKQTAWFYPAYRHYQHRKLKSFRRKSWRRHKQCFKAIIFTPNAVTSMNTGEKLHRSSHLGLTCWLKGILWSKASRLSSQKFSPECRFAFGLIAQTCLLGPIYKKTASDNGIVHRNTHHRPMKAGRFTKNLTLPRMHGSMPHVFAFTFVLTFIK